MEQFCTIKKHHSYLNFYPIGVNCSFTLANLKPFNHKGVPPPALWLRYCQEERIISTYLSGNGFATSYHSNDLASSFTGYSGGDLETFLFIFFEWCVTVSVAGYKVSQSGRHLNMAWGWNADLLNFCSVVPQLEVCSSAGHKVISALPGKWILVWAHLCHGLIPPKCCFIPCSRLTVVCAFHNLVAFFEKLDLNTVSS